MKKQLVLHQARHNDCLENLWSRGHLLQQNWSENLYPDESHLHDIVGYSQSSTVNNSNKTMYLHKDRLSFQNYEAQTFTDSLQCPELLIFIAVEARIEFRSISSILSRSSLKFVISFWIKSIRPTVPKLIQSAAEWKLHIIPHMLSTTEAMR